MLKLLHLSRIVAGIAVVIASDALLRYISIWEKQGFVDWPAFFSMTGLILLMGTNALLPPPGRLSLVLILLAGCLIFPSSLLILRR